MGIINLDEFSTPYGSNVSNVYMALAPNGITITKEVETQGEVTDMDENGNTFVVQEATTTTTYRLLSAASVWICKDARDSCKSTVSTVGVNCDLTEEDLALPPYTIAYNALKAKYPNNQDA